MLVLGLLWGVGGVRSLVRGVGWGECGQRDARRGLNVRFSKLRMGSIFV